MEDVVVTVALIELGTFAGFVLLVAVEDDTRGGKGTGTSRVKFADGNNALQLRTTAGVSVNQIDTAVVVP